MAQIDITKDRQGMFFLALSNAEPGDEIVYHVGAHAAGAHKHDAITAALEGHCILYQRRDVPTFGTFTYIAKKPRK